jgi:hypothetical protein
LVTKPTFKNQPSWVFHHASGFVHIDGNITNLQNKNISPITNAHEDFPTDVPTLNMLVFLSLIKSPSTKTTIYAWTKRFNLSKFVIRSGMTTSISYSRARWISFPLPTYFSTTHKDL